jgi:hypothetical protein
VSVGAAGRVAPIHPLSFFIILIIHNFRPRKMIRGLGLAVFLVVLTRIFGEVTVRQVTQYIYDKS